MVPLPLDRAAEQRAQTLLAAVRTVETGLRNSFVFAGFWRPAISSSLRALCLLFVAARFAAAVNPQLDEARGLRQAGKTAEARRVLDALISGVSVPEADRAQAYSELSQIDLAAGRYPDAIQNSSRAVEIFGPLKMRAGEGNALTIRGLARLYAGSYQEALSDFDPALAIATETKDASAEITRLNNIGTVFYFEGKYGAAMERYETAMRVVEAHKEEAWNLSRRQLTVANIATVYQRLGQYDRALDTYSELRKTGNALPVSEEAQLLANEGTLYRRLGDPVKALETYRAAQTLYRSRTLRNGEIAVLNNIGIAQALDLRLYSEALATFDEALAMTRQSGDLPVEVHALLYRAETLYRMHRSSDSQAGFSKAYEAATRLHATEERWKALFGMARNDAELGRHAESVSRLSEATGLIESLRGTGPSNLRGGFLADKRQVYDLQISEVLQAAGASDSVLYGMIERARLLPATATLEGLQKNLPAGTLMLDYWLGDDAVAVLWATREKTGRSLRRARDLRARLRSLAASLKNPKSEVWESDARELGKMLLPDVAGAAEIKQVIVIPDRELSLIPFDVFPLAGGRISDHAAVSYSRGGSLVASSTKKRAMWPFWKSTVLAFANPAKGAGTDLLHLATMRSNALLPGAESEVRRVASSIGGRASLHIGADAQKKYLTNSGRLRMPVLHFATHAVSDDEDPARSYILLAPDRASEAYDYLFLKEISGLKLSEVDLVTLSACESARGKMVEGEGIASFGGAFLDAGARSVVASLWPVGDQSTVGLMHDFYSSLAKGSTVAEALREAKIQARTSGRSHPYYWAGFVAGGDGQVQIPYVFSLYYLFALLLGLIGVALLAIAARRAF
jgi:CHAT domain-containing protein